MDQGDGYLQIHMRNLIAEVQAYCLKNQPEIWFLTGVSVDESTIIRHPTNGEIKIKMDTHPFGYKFGKAEVLRAVQENEGEMHECLYNYLVIERIGQGVLALAKDEQWFKWNDGKWMACPKPEWSNGLINWAHG